MKMPDYEEWALNLLKKNVTSTNYSYATFHINDLDQLQADIAEAIAQGVEQGRSLGRREGEEAMRLKLTKEYL